ncbi:hypothetical protein LK994_14435 [Ferruginibacter lapsinanis]|uniref:hypothetical protein n=1 Tax=Ferruginibacter lapsinanis TaxID=563172 RepID=UPI001E5700E2|nr:hypothetical protein [Ferruginibacter lapsinanis]UEG49835.1 hypothetical protein LK994_14435 [Ferruginibacter lapsinanis]
MTPFPNIPTDNLYKFIFISGVIMIFFSIVLFVTEYRTIRDKIDNIEVSMAKTGNEIDVLNKKIKTSEFSFRKIDSAYSILKVDSLSVKFDLDKFEELKIKMLNSKNYRDYLAFLFEHKKDLYPYFEQMEENIKTNGEINLAVNEVSLKSTLNKIGLKHLKRESNDLLILTGFVLLLIIGGYYMAKSGYSKWQTLVQRPLDEKLKLELENLKMSKRGEMDFI